MRTPGTIAIAVVAGVHCSAEPYAGTDVATEADAVTEETAPFAGTGANARTNGGQEDDRTDPRWALEAEGLPPTVFTTTVRGDDGALYAAGTFAGSLAVGADTLKSKGGDDVVLVRVEADGSVGWAKAIGSTRQERRPKVTFVDGTVRVLAETNGEVDCGSGDMGIWSSGMFFYCLYAADGTSRGGGTFPTGSP